MENKHLQLYSVEGELLGSPQWKHRVQCVERSSHRNTEHSKGFPYIHQATQEEFEASNLRTCWNQYCDVCDIKLDRSNETIRGRSWDHFLMYTCQCGVTCMQHEEINKHNQTRHKNEAESVARIEPLMLDGAHQEINA